MKKQQTFTKLEFYKLIEGDSRAISKACLRERVPSYIFLAILKDLISEHQKDYAVFSPGALPAKAPELYIHRPVKPSGQRENIVDFLRRVWKPWIDNDLLARADLRRRDEPADKAIENWLRAHKEMPDDIKILSRTDLDTKLITFDLQAALKDKRLSRIIAGRISRGTPVPGINA